MSPQSEATANINARWSSNICSTQDSATAETSVTTEYALHKIESADSQHTANSEIDGELNKSPLERKRSLDRPTKSSSLPSNDTAQQPFLSSYGSAFLSGIFADIAQASESTSHSHPSSQSNHSLLPDAAEDGPRPKKARSSASTSLGRHRKSFKALSRLADGTQGADASSSAVVSPRPNKSALKIQLFNGQVSRLQDLAFPTLPNIPAAVSSGSWSAAASLSIVTPRDSQGEAEAKQQDDSPSYGWFVSMDDDASGDTSKHQPPTSGFLPDTEAHLAFKTVSAPSSQDIEVQQALAADTVDDVLGDFF